MRLAQVWLLALVLIVGGLGMVAVSTRKTVVIMDNAEGRRLTTYASTVGQALEIAGVKLEPWDHLAPPLDASLRDGLTIAIERAAFVEIQVEDESLALHTLKRRPANILLQAQVPLFPEDQVLLDGNPVPLFEPLPMAETFQLLVDRAHKVTLVDGDQKQVFYSNASTLGEALREEKIRLGRADRLSPGPETPLDSPVTATITRARKVKITTQEETLEILTTAETVREALDDTGLQLGELDYSEPPLESPVPEDGKIRVVSVLEETVQEGETVPFETLFQPLPDVEIDRQSVVQEGAPGTWIRRFVVRYEDGQEVSKELESEWMEIDPTPRTIGYGTKITIRTVQTQDGPIKYWRALDMYAVSYSPSSAGGSITASGQKLKKGLVAVVPNYIPFSTRLYIPGYGNAIAADTGPGLSPRMIDLGYSDEDYVSWSQNVTVYFLAPAPPADQITWIIP